MANRNTSSTITSSSPPPFCDKKTANTQSTAEFKSFPSLHLPVAVVVAFFFCWAPFHAQRLVAIYFTADLGHASHNIQKIYTVVTYISGVLYYLSTCINPLLYSIMSHKFREAFKVT